MLDQILSSLKDKVGGDLINKIGLNDGQANGAIEAAGSSVQELLKGQGGDLGSVMSLFGKGGGGGDLLAQLGQNYLGKLTGQVGLDSLKAGSVKDMVLPALIGLLGDKLGGNKDLLSSLIGGKAGGLGDIAGKIGGIGKLFGKG